MRAFFLSFFLASFLALGHFLVWGQESSQTINAVPALRLQGSFYLDVATMAQLLELSLHSEGQTLLLQGRNSSLTLEANSPDVLWRQGSELENISLGAPIQRKHATWYAPPELFNLYEVIFENAALRFVDGSSYPLTPISASGSSVQAGRASIVELGNNVTGLSFYTASNELSDGLSLMLVDIALISLADPEQREAIDAFMADIREGRPLYMIVTSLETTTWESTLTFNQGTEQFVARYPLAISILSGSEDSVSPANPVIGVVILPQNFNLREPITVGWQGISQLMSFR